MDYEIGKVSQRVGLSTLYLTLLTNGLNGNCLTQLAIVNSTNCDFKVQDQSLDSTVIRGQHEDSLTLLLLK